MSRGRVALLSLIVCATLPYVAYSAPVFAGTPADELKARCEEDAGVRVYSRATDVDGYARLPEEPEPTIEQIASGNVSDATMGGDCFPCFEELVRYGYAYVETYYISAKDRKKPAPDYLLFGLQRDYYTNQTGLYRYRLVDRNESPELCQPFDHMIEKAQAASVRGDRADARLIIFEREYREHMMALAGRCIYGERIAQYTAPYVIRRTKTVIEQHAWKTAGARIVKLRRTVETTGGDVLAEGITYGLVRGEDPYSPARENCGSTQLPSLTEILSPAIPAAKER